MSSISCEYLKNTNFQAEDRKEAWLAKQILQQIETIKIIRQAIFTDEENKNKERTARRGHGVSLQNIYI